MVARDAFVTGRGALDLLGLWTPPVKPTVHVNTVTVVTTAASTTGRVSDPASGGTVLAGTRFTPTAGRLLLCVGSGAVNQTLPSGSPWTLPTNGDAVSNGGHFLFTKTAAGGGNDSLTFNSNGTGAWPTIHTFLEFVSGVSLLGVAKATGVASGGTGPVLAMAAGTKSVYAGANGIIGGTSGSITFTWDQGVEVVDVSTPSPDGSIQGSGLGINLVQDTTSTSMSQAATAAYSGTSTVGLERLIWAIVAN